MLIRTFIINLRSRIDRKEHIKQEFAGRNEFLTTIVDAYTHNVGAVGLWNTIRHIIQDLATSDDDFILICEDDHVFTENYSKDNLFRQISEAQKLNCDVLSGGVSWFMDAAQISECLFWVKKFSGAQFIIIFKDFFKTILNASFTQDDCADLKLSSLSNHIYFLFPFISTQKEFGYSDVTQKNNGTERVETLFINSYKNAKSIFDIKRYYNSITINKNKIDTIDDYENLQIPTYVINLPERIDRRNHILKQFKERPEFNVILIEAYKNEIGSLGLWLSFRKIIELAIENEDDVIIICEDDHEFTSSYSKKFLFQNILDANNQGALILTGGASGFGVPVPVSESRFWVNWFYGTQFIILYKPLFEKILHKKFDKSVTSDGILSELTNNKMVLYPFVSIQKDFGYSDVTSKNNDVGHIQWLFANSFERLKNIHSIVKYPYRKFEKLTEIESDRGLSQEDFYTNLFIKNNNWNKPAPNDEEKKRWTIIQEFLFYIQNLKEEKNNTFALKILDIGCGRGWLTNLLSDYGDVTGVEPIKPVVEYAKKLFPTLDFKHGNSETLIRNGEKEFYDIVVCSEVIEHIPNDNKNNFLSQLHFLLKKNGFLIVTTPREEAKSEWEKYSNPNQPVEDWTSEPFLQDLLTKNGFLKHCLSKFSASPHPIAPQIEIYQLWLARKI